MQKTDPRMELINKLYGEILTTDPSLAEIIKKQEGTEPIYGHLQALKDNLHSEESVHTWIHAARLYSCLRGSTHEGTAILHRVYEKMLELADKPTAQLDADSLP